LQQYFQTRSSDQQALGTALKSCDLATAQQKFNAIQTLGQSGPFANGNANKITPREHDFTAVGQTCKPETWQRRSRPLPSFNPLLIQRGHGR
jgi:hypothetical protein